MCLCWSVLACGNVPGVAVWLLFMAVRKAPWRSVCGIAEGLVFVLLLGLCLGLVLVAFVQALLTSTSYHKGIPTFTDILTVVCVKIDATLRQHNVGFPFSVVPAGCILQSHASSYRTDNDALFCARQRMCVCRCILCLTSSTASLYHDGEHRATAHHTRPRSDAG